jgi:hypothetical protein
MEILHNFPHALPDSSPNPSDDACRAHRLIGRGELPELGRFRFHLQHPLLRGLANHRRTTFRRL